MQKIHRAEAERLLGVSSSTMYNWANKLGIEFLTEINSVGKSSFVRWEDLESMAKAMWKSLSKAEEWVSSPNDSSSVEESSDRVQEKFELKVQLAEQSETIKANTEIISHYKEQNGYFQQQINQEQKQKGDLFQELIKTKTKATAFLVSSIALGAVLLLVIVLAFVGVLQF